MKTKILCVLTALALLLSSFAHCGPLTILFHGSSECFDQVEPRPSTRIGKEGNIVWDGEAIFATQDFRIALFYTHTRWDGNRFYGGINLVDEVKDNEPITYALYGGKNIEEALDALYGIKGKESSKGYIYLLDSSYFQWVDGLGSMERISTDRDANLGKVEIDRRSLIDHFVNTGKVKLEWIGLYPLNP